MAENSWNSSYIFGVDNESGWGERYFFTYYSEFGTRSPLFITIELTIFTIMFLSSIVANVLIMICVTRFPDMRTVTNTLVLNLAAADILLVLTIPEVAYTRVIAQWKLGNPACKIVPYVQFVSGIVLLWTLALISVDRYRCIIIPPYRSPITPSQASLLCAIIWMLAAIILTPIAFWFNIQTSQDGKTCCTLVFPKSDNVNYSLCFVVPVVLFACLLPMSLLVYNYQVIFHKIMSTKNTWASSCVVAATETSNYVRGRRQSEVSVTDIFVPWPRKLSVTTQSNSKARQGSLSQHEEIRVNKHIKVVRVLFLNVVLVLLMWIPIIVVIVLIFFDGKRPTEDTNFFLRSYHFIMALIVAYLNSIVNPLLYGMLSDSFRVCLEKMWCSSKKGDRARIIRDAITPSSARGNCESKTPRKLSLANSVSDTHNVI